MTTCGKPSLANAEKMRSICHATIHSRTPNDSISSCKFMSCCFSSLSRLRAVVIITTTPVRSGTPFNRSPGAMTGASPAVFESHQIPTHLLLHIAEQLDPFLILPLRGGG